MLGLLPSTIILFLAFIHGILSSGITTFTDKQCKASHDALEVENGYPDGLCTELNIRNGLEAFQIVQLDPGCAVTLYGPNDDSGQSCSSPIKIVGELAACYNSSWVYFSVDGCIKPNSSSSSAPVVLPTVAPSDSSTISSSSATSTYTPSPTSSASQSKSTTTPPSTKNAETLHTPALIGTIIGSVAFCAALIALLLFCLSRRKSQHTKKFPPPYELSPERALTEMPRGSVVPPERTSQKEMWGSEVAVEIGRSSYTPPVELPAGTSGGDKKVGELVRVRSDR